MSALRRCSPAIVILMASIGGCGGEAPAGPQPPILASVAVTPGGATLLSMGKTVQLSATAYDANGNAMPGTAYAWSSSDEEVVTVSATGLVKGEGLGTATVTVEATSGGQSVTNTLSIIVNQLILEPADRCADNPSTAIATFEDSNLETSLRDTLSLGVQDDLTCGLLATLTQVNASAGIVSLVGLQNLTSMTRLNLYANAITDISVLSELPNLMSLILAENSITDISALSGLTSLMSLFLSENPITDISALSGLTNLTLLVFRTTSITDLSPLSGLTTLETLNFIQNSITDITPLSGLTSLMALYADDNLITDISALSGLTGLHDVRLGENPNLSNIQPLLDNTGLGAGDRIYLRGTNVSCTDVAVLKAKGVTVESDCP